MIWGCKNFSIKARFKFTLETFMQEHLTIVDHPLVKHKLSHMRDENTSSNHFRQLMRETSQLLAYEVTRNLKMENKTIRTPMQEMESPVIAGKKLALVSILRALKIDTNASFLPAITGDSISCIGVRIVLFSIFKFLVTSYASNWLVSRINWRK